MDLDNDDGPEGSCADVGGSLILNLCFGGARTLRLPGYLLDPLTVSMSCSIYPAACLQLDLTLSCALGYRQGSAYMRIYIYAHREVTERKADNDGERRVRAWGPGLHQIPRDFGIHVTTSLTFVWRH